MFPGFVESGYGQLGELMLKGACVVTTGKIVGFRKASST